MIIECKVCQKPHTIDESVVQCPNDIIQQAPEWSQNDNNEWLCPEHKLKQYKFIADTVIEASTEEEAKDEFANNSSDFASNASCYLID